MFLTKVEVAFHMNKTDEIRVKLDKAWCKKSDNDQSQDVMKENEFKFTLKKRSNKFKDDSPITYVGLNGTTVLINGGVMEPGVWMICSAEPPADPKLQSVWS